MLSDGPPFLALSFLMIGFEFGSAWGNPTSVNDHVMTSEDYAKIEHVKT